MDENYINILSPKRRDVTVHFDFAKLAASVGAIALMRGRLRLTRKVVGGLILLSMCEVKISKTVQR